MGIYDDAIDKMMADQGAVGAPNPYDDAITQMKAADDRRTAQAALAVGFSADQNPDKAAQNNMLAKRYNTTPDVVAKFPDEFRQRMTVEATRDALAQAPTLRNQIASNPKAVAPMVHDDIPTLSAIDKTIQDHAISMPYEFMKGLGGLSNATATAVNLAMGAPVAIRGYLTGDTDIGDRYFAAMVDPLVARQQRFTTEYDSTPTLGNKLANALGNAVGLLSQATLGGAAMAPAQAVARAAPTVGEAVGEQLTHSAGMMAFPSITAAINTGRDVLERTGDPVAALRAAQAQYVGSTVGGVLPMSAGGGVVSRVLQGAVSGGVGGKVQSQTVNWGMPTDMQQPFTSEDWLLSGLAGSVLGVGGGHGPQHDAAYDAIRKTYTDAAQSEAATKDFQTLSSLGQLSAASKWRERDPEGFKGFVDAATEDGQLANVYVEGQVLHQALLKAGVSADDVRATMPDVAAQMQEALHTDGYVRIPTADYATHIAGGPMDADLLPNLKTDPLGKTYSEAQTFYQDQAERMKEMAANAASSAEENAGFRRGQDEIQGQLEQRLEDLNRFPASVNKTYATMQAALLSRVAEREGITPQAALEKYAPQLVGEGIPGGALAQSGEPVATLAGNEIHEDLKPENVVGAARDYFKQNLQGTTAHREGLGEVRFSGKGWEKLRKGLTTDVDKARLIPAIKAIIEQGNYQGRFPIDKPRSDAIVAFHHFDAPVRLGDRVVEAGVSVGEDKQGKLFYNLNRDPADLLAKRKGLELTRGTSPEEQGPSEGGETLKQSVPESGHEINIDLGQDGARGSFNPDAKTISLFKDADLSTFVHETGHWALDTYTRIAANPDAPPDVRADVDKLMQWFGVKDLGTWHGMPLDEQRQHHEQFARAFEAYMFEGKAPSQALQPLFARIKSWMLSIYRELRNLNVQLTPEVRGVFDRMMASEDAIHQAEAARVFEPLFKAKPPGMDAAEWEAYASQGERATNEAVGEMQAKSLRDMKWAQGAQSRMLKEMQKQADGIRKTTREEVAKEVDKEPIYRAERWLRKGEMVDEDGNVIATSPEARKGAKLNSDAVKELFPEGALDRPDLDAIDGMTSPHGLDPELVADMFGFPSGEDLIRQLAAREPREGVIDALTDRRMLEEHGELSSPQGIADAAAAAIHNDVRARFVATGLKVLTKSPVSARALLNGAREAAEAAVAQKRVRDLNPRQYEAAETKANREALKAVAKSPRDAIVAQRASLLNNQLVKATQKAITDVQRGIEYLKKFNKPSVREKIDVAFRDQIDALLARYDLRSSLTPEEAAGKRVQSLESFVEKLAAMKFAIDVPESMLNDTQRVHFKDMTVENFRGLVDAVRSIDHLGRELQRVQDGAESRLLKEVAQEAVDQTANLPKRTAETNRGLSMIAEKWIKTKAFGRSVQASLLKMEQMIDWLDNYNSKGVFNRMVFRKIADAEGARNDLDKKITQQWETYVKGLPKDLLKANRGSAEMPGVIDALTGKPQRLTWGEKIALAGIRGDAGHFAKLLKSEGWDANAVLDFLHNNMAKEEWHFVRGLADTFQELFPLKTKMLRDLGSTAPKEVARIPFDTPHGEMPGWYWPISYDPARSHSVKERAARHEASLFEDNIFNRADTSTGRENTRNENYAKPMLLSIDVLPRVLKDEIRDITTRRAIIEADRFLSHPDVRKTITGVLSEQHYDTFNGWLLSLANDAAVKPSELQMWDRIAHEIRTRVTMVGLGFRVSTMLMHGMTAAGESVAEAGPKAMVKGIADKRTLAALTTLGPKWLETGLANFIRSDQFEANRDFIFERSAEMRNRSNELERDVREQLRAIHLKLMDPATGAVARAKLAIESRAYQGIAMLDMASALPTWMGGYLKALTPEAKGGLGMNEQDAVYFADKTVRNAHGGGGIKDIAAVQRGGEWFKLFTMFYTFWNHNVNRIMDTAKRVKELPMTFADAKQTGDWAGFRGDVGTLILRSFMYTLGVQAVHHMIHPPKEDKNNPEGWLAWFGKAMANAAFGGVPLARDVVGHFAGGKDYEVSPISAAVSNTDMLVKDADGKSQSDHFIKHALTEAGYVFGLPLGQVGSSAQFLSDVWNGKQHPQDISEWWRGATTGDVHKH